MKKALKKYLLKLLFGAPVYMIYLPDDGRGHKVEIYASDSSFITPKEKKE